MRLWVQIPKASTRAMLTSRIRAELARVTAATDSQARAVQVLAGRLQRRLDAQERQGTVTDPVGWILGRGLPRGASNCWQTRCDDGTRMDTGQPCEACESRLAGQRFKRRHVFDEVAAELPAAPAPVRRVEAERRLRAEATLEAERQQQRSEQAAAERAMRELEAELARAAAEAREEERRVAPCADCGRPLASGLCPACGERRAVAHRLRKVEDLVEQAALAAVTMYAGPGQEHVNLDSMIAEAQTSVRAKVAAAQARVCEQGATDLTAAMEAEYTATLLVDQYRKMAINTLNRQGAAAAEAVATHERQLRESYRLATGRGAKLGDGDAEAHTEFVAHEARRRAAQDVFGSRLASLRVRNAPPKARQLASVRMRAGASWAQTMAMLAERPLAQESAAAGV